MRHLRTAGTIDLELFEDRDCPVTKVAIRVQDVASTLTLYGDWGVHFVGRRGFERSIYGSDYYYRSQYHFSEKAAAKAWEEYQKHLKYHDTLDLIVRERLQDEGEPQE